MSAGLARRAASAAGRWIDRHPTWAPLATSALVRMAMLGSLPLLVLPDSTSTPEGQGYLVSALRILEQGDWSGHPIRTPGYPAILAAAFAVFGVSGMAILLLQHIQGFVTVLLLTRMAAKIAGARVAVATGVLVALDPWHLLFAHGAVTESSMVLAVVAAAATIVLPERRRLWAGALLGALCGGICLIRPTGQLLVPFFGLAFLFSGSRSLAPLLRSGAVFAVGVALVVGPWLAFNVSRGVPGFAEMRQSVFFHSFSLHGLLDRESMPESVPPELRDCYERTIARAPTQKSSDIFMHACKELDFPRSEGVAWTTASLRAQPLSYLRAVGDTLRWQLNVGVAGRPAAFDELRFIAEQLTVNRKEHGERAPNFFDERGLLSGHRRFSMTPGLSGTLAAEFFRPCYSGALRGIPQIPLGIAALAALVVALIRRRLPEFFVLAGSLAFVVAHAVILYPWQRYSLPAVMLWYLSIPLLASAIRPSLAEPSSDASARADGSEC